MVESAKTEICEGMAAACKISRPCFTIYACLSLTGRLPAGGKGILTVVRKGLSTLDLAAPDREEEESLGRLWNQHFFTSTC